MYDAGLKGYLGIQMRLMLRMSPRNHLVPSLHLIILVITRTEILWSMILEAGKVKGIGKRNGEKHMPEKGSLHSLLSMLTGFHQSLHKKRTTTLTFFLMIVSLLLLIVETSSQSKEFQDRLVLDRLFGVQIVTVQLSIWFLPGG